MFYYCSGKQLLAVSWVFRGKSIKHRQEPGLQLQVGQDVLFKWHWGFRELTMPLYLPVLLQVDPYFCYLVVAVQMAVYAAGTWLAVAQGPGSAEQWAVALSLQPHEVLTHGESWRLATSLLLHGGIAHLTLDTLLLGWFGPGARFTGEN